MKNQNVIKSTSNLKVVRLDNNTFLTWTPNVYGLIPPKLRVELNDEGHLIKVKVIGSAKAIIINSLIAGGLISLGLYIAYGTIKDIANSYLLFLGTIIFMTFINFLTVWSTKSKIKSQRK